MLYRDEPEAAKAVSTPLLERMSNPPNGPKSIPNEPTVKSRPVLGDTAGERSPGRKFMLPCIARVSKTESITNSVVLRVGSGEGAKELV
jgi:hypothetical protein